MSILKICKNLGERKKNFDYLFMLLGFPDAQTVKNMPTVQETGVWSLGQEDFLEKGMAIHCSFLA